MATCNFGANWCQLSFFQNEKNLGKYVHGWRLALSLFLSLFLSLSTSRYQSFSLSIFLYISLYLSIFFFLHICLYLFISLSISLYLLLSPYLSLSLFLSLSQKTPIICEQSWTYVIWNTQRVVKQRKTNELVKRTNHSVGGCKAKDTKLGVQRTKTDTKLCESMSDKVSTIYKSIRIYGNIVFKIFRQPSVLLPDHRQVH